MNIGSMFLIDLHTFTYSFLDSVGVQHVIRLKMWEQSITWFCPFPGLYSPDRIKIDFWLMCPHIRSAMVCCSALSCLVLLFSAGAGLALISIIFWNSVFRREVKQREFKVMLRNLNPIEHIGILKGNFKLFVSS